MLEGGITFDDVFLVPKYSDVLPSEVSTETRLTRSIRLKIPLCSAPMDTVTESALAIALAQEGGVGIIHRNLTIEEQVREVDAVKRSANGIILDPVTLSPDESIARAAEIMNSSRISGLPIIENGRLVGILTRRDLKFQSNAAVRIREVMTKDNLVTAPYDTTLAEAEEILQNNKVEKLLIVDNDFRLAGLVTMRDIDRSRADEPWLVLTGDSLFVGDAAPQPGCEPPAIWRAFWTSTSACRIEASIPWARRVDCSSRATGLSGLRAMIQAVMFMG